MWFVVENDALFVRSYSNSGKIKLMRNNPHVQSSRMPWEIVVGTKDAPVGDYALQIINRLGNDFAYGQDYNAWVTANIISQEITANYVVTKVALGGAGVGFAYVSDLTEDLASRVDLIDIPDEYNILAEYPLGILLGSKYPAQSQDFINLVTSDQGKAILKKYDFSVVHSSLTEATGNAAAAKAAPDPECLSRKPGN